MAGLTATSGTGTQTTTQSPQAATTGSTSPAQPTGLQPGTATSLLNGQGSVTLQPTPLSTISLGGTSQQTTSSPSLAPVRHQHVNFVLVGLVAVVLLIALVCTVVFSKQVKSTTL